MPRVVPKGAGTFKSARQIVHSGEIKVRDLEKFIPKNAVPIWKDQDGSFKSGFKYSFTSGGKKYEVWVHERDTKQDGAGTNSDLGPIVRIKRGIEYLTSKGKWVDSRNVSDMNAFMKETHISLVPSK